MADLTEQLTRTEQLVAQLKELVREKDAELRNKDLQLKVPRARSFGKDCLKKTPSALFILSCFRSYRVVGGCSSSGNTGSVGHC